MHRINITGASGSGTTTLGMALSKSLGIKHFDADDFFWLPTINDYTSQRERFLRHRMLEDSLADQNQWILSGAITNWDTVVKKQINLVVFLYIPSEIRIARLHKRESKHFGIDKISPGGELYEGYCEFIDWALKYDIGGMEIRSRCQQEDWMSKLSCPVVRIEGDTTVEYRVSQVRKALGLSS